MEEVSESEEALSRELLNLFNQIKNRIVFALPNRLLKQESKEKEDQHKKMVLRKFYCVSVPCKGYVLRRVTMFSPKRKKKQS